jgi:Flp pilus assembly protein TadG
VTRTWTDANGNFSPDCNLSSIAQQDGRTRSQRCRCQDPAKLAAEMFETAQWSQASQAAQALATRLTQVPVDGQQDLLRELITRGFLSATGMPAGGTSAVGGQGEAAVTVTGGVKPPAVDPSLFFLPLVQTLVDAQAAVAAANPTVSTYQYVSLIRDDGNLDGRLVTVDDVETAAGQLALAVGLADLIATPGQGGNYGVGDGADFLPPLL